jgi:DNA-directed RNA polymerase specialized sigma24 family protein
MRTPEAEDDFAAFVRARQHALVRFGYLITGDRMSGEDLTQTALAKLYLKWDTIRHTEAVEAWVRRVMVNEHTTWWRRAWRHRERLDFDTAHSETRASAQPAPFDDDLWRQVLASRRDSGPRSPCATTRT